MSAGSYDQRVHTGLCLQGWRVELGLSRKDVCTAMQIPYRSLQNWELAHTHCPPYIFKFLEFYYKTLKKRGESNGLG